MWSCWSEPWNVSSGRIAGADTACWTALYNTNNISITSISPNTKHGKKQKQEEKRNKNKTKEEGTRKKETLTHTDSAS
jgi:hypothetical protein